MKRWMYGPGFGIWNLGFVKAESGLPGGQVRFADA
jgi:hypothetical protein